MSGGCTDVLLSRIARVGQHPVRNAERSIAHVVTDLSFEKQPFPG
jgi:hypothetical protein